MEDNFEKKSGKKVGVIISVIVVLLVAAIAAGFIYLSQARKPEKIFSKAIEDAFEMKEKEEAKSAKIDLELSMEMKSNDSEIVMINEVLKSVKLHSTTEVDIDKQIFNENLKVTYAGEEIVSADALIQGNGMYFYLKDIYSKYISVPEEYFAGEDLSAIFEVETEISPEKLVKDIEKVLLDEISSKEFKKENVELNGNNVQKSTVKLTSKELLEILVKVFEVINEQQPTEEFEELIEDLKLEVEYVDDTNMYMEISLYTKGLTNELVKAEITIVNVEYDEKMVFEINKEAEKKYNMAFIFNGQKLMEITLKTEDDNKGTIKIKINIDEENSVTLKIKYKIDNNAKIEKRDVSNNISIDNLTDADFEEMYTNIENNTILYSIIQQFMATEDYYYEDEYYYDDEYDYYYDDEYDYTYDDYIY